MDTGTEDIGDADVREAVRAQARRVVLKAFAAAALLTLCLLLAP